MSGKLDMALEEIVSSNRARGGRRGRGGRRASTRATATAPAGGIKKNTRPARGAVKATVPTGPAGGSGESKVIVSNLPSDVNEQQIKEYFSKSVGPVKRANITYGPNGVSRGIATIVFHKRDAANEALTKLNGVLVDKRPMKVEVVLDASRAPPPPPVKGLGDRITQSKAQPKSAAATKATTNGASTRGGRARGRGGRKAGRPKRKTAEELDEEMVDYFDVNAATNGAAVDGAVNGTAQAAANDDGMDEIS
ncbi:pyridoxal reductase [Physcia stellaris]|nr:pyridoxal reductase [Physcia stellaris]